MALPILTLGNTKIQKGEKSGYLTAGIHFAPANLSGRNVCPFASKGCAAACLNTSGRGAHEKTQRGRIKKTQWFFDNRENFMAQLLKDIQAVIRKAARESFIPTFRLNLTSDISWENIIHEGKTVFEHFPEIQFYDYTKIPQRIIDFVAGKLPANYHLTFSRSETNSAQCELVVASGGNVAVVFSSKDYPAQFYGVPVIDGDENDLRFTDPNNCVVGLYAKGDGKKDASGFVVSAI